MPMPRIFDSETAKKQKEAGCRIVKFGLESGSDRIRRTVLQRFMSNNILKKLLKSQIASDSIRLPSS
jgi:radical SAM superfamily enzyme YgiQ (UPF0313 family)